MHSLYLSLLFWNSKENNKKKRKQQKENKRFVYSMNGGGRKLNSILGSIAEKFAGQILC